MACVHSSAATGSIDLGLANPNPPGLHSKRDGHRHVRRFSFPEEDSSGNGNNAAILSAEPVLDFGDPTLNDHL